MANSNFQETVLSDFDLFSCKPKRMPQKLVYGSNAKNLNFRTLNAERAKPKELSYAKSKDVGLADYDQKLKDHQPVSLLEQTEEDVESRVETRQANRCRHGIVEKNTGN